MKEKLITFLLNNNLIEEKINPSLPLLDYIRGIKHLSGTKEVCKEGDCGACTVLLGELKGNGLCYKTITSCIYPVGNCSGKHIVTIEGITKNDKLLLQQQAFVDEHASQCGFCTPGFIMSLTGYLVDKHPYNIEEGVNSLAGNICRCTGYHSIERAVRTVLNSLSDLDGNNHLQFLINKNVVPGYFSDVRQKLLSINSVNESNSSKSNIFIGGGSDLFVQRPDEILDAEPDFLNLKNLNRIEQSDNVIRLGSGVTFEDIKHSELLNKIIPGLANQINLVASLPVRNAATIGGNLANASPIGDLTIILLALESKLIISDNVNEKLLPLKDFYLDYKKLNKQSNEYIHSIEFKIPSNNFHFNFEKVSKRTFLDIASVNSAILIETENDKIISCNLSAGGIAPVPKLLIEFNTFLSGRTVCMETINSALDIAQNEITPISDVRGSETYKRLLLSQLIKAHFLKLFPQYISESELV